MPDYSIKDIASLYGESMANIGDVLRAIVGQKRVPVGTFVEIIATGEIVQVSPRTYGYAYIAYRSTWFFGWLPCTRWVAVGDYRVLEDLEQLAACAAPTPNPNPNDSEKEPT
jgi:hypothetical protein